MQHLPPAASHSAAAAQNFKSQILKSRSGKQWKSLGWCFMNGVGEILERRKISRLKDTEIE